MQSYFLIGRNYSVCYNFAVGTNGTIWELRGYGIRNAANAGDRTPDNSNATTISILIVTQNDDMPTNAQVASVNALIADRPTFAVNGHNVYNWTSCPGLGIKSLLGVALLVIAVLVFVILATGWVMWREERAFHDERKARQRLKKEVNRKIRDEEIER